MKLIKKISLIVLVLVFTTSAYSQLSSRISNEYIAHVNGNINTLSANLLEINATTQVLSKATNLVLLKTPRSLRSLKALIEKSTHLDSQISFIEPNYIIDISYPPIDNLPQRLKSLTDDQTFNEETEYNIPNDPNFTKQWGLHNTGQRFPSFAPNNVRKTNQSFGKVGIDIDLLNAWEIHRGSKKTIVAVIDTGIDYNHIDLKDNIWVNKSELFGEKGKDDDGNGFVDDIYGYDFANKKSDPMDEFGHGTHVAGVIGAKPNNNIGISGINHDIQIMALKFISKSNGNLANAIKAIDYAVNNGASILNNSWSSPKKSKALEKIIQYAEKKNVLFIAASGNQSKNNDKTPRFPASYKLNNIISVGSSDSYGYYSFFANFGKLSVDIAAPGMNIYSTFLNNSYKSLIGTSMAAPFVTGVAALLKSSEPNLSAIEIKQRLLKSAKPYARIRGQVLSNGTLNAYHALNNSTPEADPTDPFNWKKITSNISTSHPYKNRQKKTWNFHVDGARQMALHFSRFDLKDGDTLTFYDHRGNKYRAWTGDKGETFSPVMYTHTITIEFVSDRRKTAYGFDITGISYKLF